MRYGIALLGILACVSLTSGAETLFTAGPQEFYYQDKDGKGSFRSENGTIQTYCRREGNFMVLIVWRVPQRAEKNVGNLGLDQWAPRVAGTVTLEGG